MSKYSISTNVLLTLILLVLIVIGTTACTESLFVKPDADVVKITPAQAEKWGKANKDEPNAALFIIHSENMKDFVKWLNGLGIDVKWIKSEEEIHPKGEESEEKVKLPQGQKEDKADPT